MAPPKPVKPAQQVNLSKISNRVGFGLSGLMVFNLVLAFGITWLVMWVCLALSANIGSVASLASSSEFLWVVQFSVTTLACGGAILLLRGLLKIKIRSFFQRPYHGAAYMAGGSVVALGVNLTVGLIITSVQMMLNQFFDTQGLNSPDFSLSSFSPVSLVFYLLAIFVAAPLLEEIIFRGYVLRAFQRYGNVFAILVSSFAFGLYHGNLTQALQTTCVGLVLAYVALRSNSLIPCVIIHVINNAIAVISTMASDWLPEAVAVVVNLALVFLPIILSIVVLAVYARNLRIQNNNLSGLKTGTCVTTTLLSPGMIVFVAISLLEVVIYLFG